MAKFGPQRFWCFTWNNYDFIPDELPMHGRYAVLGEEICPDTGTPHLQCYIEFKKQQRHTAIQKWVKCKVHCEPRRGNNTQARQYCFGEVKGKPKNDVVHELGEWREGATQGAREDLIAIYELAKSDVPMTEVADSDPYTYMKFDRAVGRVRHLHGKPAIRVGMKIIFHIGPTRAGKTRAVYEAHPDVYALPIGNGLWFDGYDGEKVALIDDFSGQMPVTSLLRVLDIYPIQTQCKGAHIWFKPMTIYITSNIEIDEWYNWERRLPQLAALKARITKTVRFPIAQHALFNKE